MQLDLTLAFGKENLLFLLNVHMLYYEIFLQQVLFFHSLIRLCLELIHSIFLLNDGYVSFQGSSPTQANTDGGKSQETSRR